jgi:hypothetical protein
MSIALSLGNNLTTGGIFKPTAVNNTSINNVTDFAGIAGGGTLILLSTQTASSSATISFTTGLDSTYDEYIFKFINIHPSVDNTDFQFNMSTDGSNYNVTKTTTAFAPFHDEADTTTGLSYSTSNDLAQSTAFQNLLGQSGIGNDNDQSASGYLQIFNPSSTTYVKHFIARNNYSHPSDYTVEYYVAGYGNTTSAVNAIQFKMSSGNIDDGVIKLYGVKKS